MKKNTYYLLYFCVGGGGGGGLSTTYVQALNTSLSFFWIKQLGLQSASGENYVRPRL